MGACDFYTRARGATAAEAYAKAVEEASHLYGNDGYSEAINTTAGFMMVSTKLRGTELQEFMEEAIMNDTYPLEKRGKCACIDLGDGLYQFFGWAAC